VKYHLIVRRLAERNLEEAKDWYDKQQSGLGSELLETMSDLFGRLGERFPYVVYYLIEKSEVIAGSGRVMRLSTRARDV
jgi:hypothetical protein